MRKCVSGMMHGGRDQKGRKEEGGGGRRRNGGGGGPGGHAGDEGEELVMVMRRCNDSSAVRSELALSFPLFFSSFSLSILFASLDSLPSLCLRMAMIPGTAYAPFYALLFTGTWLLSAQLAISAVRLCMWSARALIRRIMGRLLTLNTVNNSRSGAALSVTRNRRCSNEYFAITAIVMRVILICEFKGIQRFFFFFFLL